MHYALELFREVDQILASNGSLSFDQVMKLNEAVEYIDSIDWDLPEDVQDTYCRYLECIDGRLMISLKLIQRSRVAAVR